jgi:hypothetical protein
MRASHILQGLLLVAGVGAKIPRRQFLRRGLLVGSASSGHGDTNKYIVEFSQVSIS